MKLKNIEIEELKWNLFSINPQAKMGRLIMYQDHDAQELLAVMNLNIFIDI